MADKSFADLLREAGVQPSGAIQYAQSLNRPVPYRNYTPPRPLPRRMRPADVRAYDDNAGVAQQAMGEMRRDRMTGQDAMLREAQGPASNQFADAGMVALETTGVPALRRSYDAFEAGDPRQGIYEGIWGGVGLAGTLGAIPGARRTPRLPAREPVAPPSRFREQVAPALNQRRALEWNVTHELEMPELAASPNAAGHRRAVMQYQKTPQGYRIVGVTMPDAARQQGNGLALYEELIRRAQADNLPIISDSVVTQDARNVYDALERRGYRVERDADGKPVSIRPAQSAPDAGGGGAGQEWREQLRADGFDVDTALYRGTTAGVDLSASRPIFLTREPQYANNLAGAGETGHGVQPDIIPGAQVEQFHARIRRPIRLPNDERTGLSSIETLATDARRIARYERQGYDAAISDDGQVLVFNRQNVRSRFGGNQSPDGGARGPTDAPTAGPSRPPPDTSKSYRPGPPKGGFLFSRRR